MPFLESGDERYILAIEGGVNTNVQTVYMLELN